MSRLKLIGASFVMAAAWAWMLWPSLVQAQQSYVFATTTPFGLTTANTPGSCTSVAATTTVLASFSTRHGAVLVAQCDPSACNTDTVFLKFGATATTAAFPLAPGDKVILQGPAIYTGTIDAIANSGTQKVCAIEF